MEQAVNSLTRANVPFYNKYIVVRSRRYNKWPVDPFILSTCMKICSLGMNQTTFNMEEMFVLYAAFVGLPVGLYSSSDSRNNA